MKARLKKIIGMLIAVGFCSTLFLVVPAQASIYDYIALPPGSTTKINIGTVQADSVIRWYLEVYNYSYYGVAYCIELPNSTHTPIKYMSYYYIYDQYITPVAGTYKLVLQNTLPDTIMIYYSIETSTVPKVTITSPFDGEINPKLITAYQYGYPVEYLLIKGEVSNISSSYFGYCHDVYLYIDDLFITNYHFHPYSSSLPWSITVNAQLLDEGKHEIRADLLVYYSYEPLDSCNVSVTFDFTLPSLEIISPVSGMWINSTNLILAWSGEDSLTGIDSYEVKIDSGSWRSVELVNETNISSIQDGIHNVSVRATDLAGNRVVQSIVLMNDRTSPVVAKLSPITGTTVTTSTVLLSWSGSDSTSGIDHFEIKIDDDAWMDVATVNEYQIDNLPSGSHTVTVRAIDRAGNVDTRTTVFTVDTDAFSLSGPYSGVPTLLIIALIIIAIIFILAFKGGILLKRGGQPPKS
ncbi:MAG: Ig-like domain-containing protein [Thermoplasmata archaeon]